jgi:hypothetical protein
VIGDWWRGRKQNCGYSHIGLDVFTVGPDGSLTPIAGSPFTDPKGGFDVTNSLFFHPNGKYVYALGYPPQTGVPGRIYAYSIASNGQLVPLPGSPYQLPGAQFIAPELAMAMDPGGNFITVSNPVNNQTYANYVYLISTGWNSEAGGEFTFKRDPADLLFCR